MHVMDGIWTCMRYILGWLTLSPFANFGSVNQKPLFAVSDVSTHSLPRGPIFKPPGGSLKGPDANFTCDYSNMRGWSSCSTSDDRSCWLRNDLTNETLSIHTDYEDTTKTPIGKSRIYYLDIADGSYNGDGQDFPEAKLFNNSYPGPWIQACWGDMVTIIVTNSMKSNGTSIHWHGVRQLNSMQMDGVNGVTQCPIAPGDSFNYTWHATQYGSSWYHSHYSVQYADGAVGPLTLHGPTIIPYDVAKDPILMTDWGHNSAFEAITTDLVNKSILLNGTGDVHRYNNKIYPNLPTPPTFKLHFIEGTRYLLRIINTSFKSTFIFSIDEHELQVVTSDFVPIYNYTTKSILVGIGQRYNVIVNASPSNISSNGNYWIRTWQVDCFVGNEQGSKGYEETGIISYGESLAPPNTTKYPVDTTDCSDEPYASLVPVVEWDVGPPANGPVAQGGEHFSVTYSPAPAIFPLAQFSIAKKDKYALRVDYENPTFLNLNNTGAWNPLWVVIPENFKDTDWVYIAIESGGAHPMHLHGHDFAILQQVKGKKFPKGLNLTTTKPPRRDVILLPDGGYVVIAFKADNPGTWLMHCHIAEHASWGLGLQIMERQADAQARWPSYNHSLAIRTVTDGCYNWNKWWGNCTNWWPGGGKSCPYGDLEASPDSGI